MGNKLRHTRVDWNSNHERIILYADIMGFKQLLRELTHEEIVNKLRLFVDNIRKRMSPYQTAGHLRMTLFSDLVVMAVDSCSTKNFLLIVKAAAELMRECHIHGFPVNGCISCGNLIFDDSIEGNKDAKPKIPYMPLFAGQSVVDAYLLNEDLFCYGIVLHPNSEKILTKTLDEIAETTEEQPPFKILNVPLKNGGYAPLYYFNWNKVKLAKNDIAIDDIVNRTMEISKDIVPRTRAYAYNTLSLITNFKEDGLPNETL